PLHVGSIFLRQDGYLEHHFLADGKVRVLKEAKELADDGPCVGGVTHAVQKIQSLPPNTDVPVLQRPDDDVLVLFNGIQSFCPRSKMRHGIQTEVADVSLTRLDKLAQA